LRSQPESSPWSNCSPRRSSCPGDGAFRWLLDTGSTLGIWLAFILAIPLGVYTVFAVECSYFVELFGTRARTTGISLARELAALLIAGPGPFVSAALVAWAHSYRPVAVLIW
jgi:hypothetical protein